MIPVTCPDINVVFDAPDSEAEDYDDTWILYEVLNATVGS